MFGGQDRSTAKYVAENDRLSELAIRQQLVARAFFAVVSTFFSITPVAVYLVAGIELAHHNSSLTAGTIIAVTTLQARLFMPIAQTLTTATEVSGSVALFHRVFDYLDLDPDITDSPHAVTLNPREVRGEVALRNVWFTYQPERADDAAASWALRDVDLTVRPGQLAAIVGSSGAGKTTISYLLPRLYDPTRGQVTLDGHDLRSLSQASVADVVGMVTQETYLFHATIGDNISYARPDAGQDEIEAAARAANIHDRIMSFGEGYDTVVGERGYRLSGGEKQRLAIARVLLKNPRVLILDEATSALDTISERLVQSALEPLMSERTTIAIAHRLSTIRAADVIFAMEAGRVVESGTHDELLAHQGVYARLYDEQFGGGSVEATCADGVLLASGQVVNFSPS